jgi:hypothetical protein
METNRLTSTQRLALAIGALATLLAMGMAQCASLSVDNTARMVLTATSAALSVLCVSILLEDMLVQPILRHLRGLGRKVLLTE